MLFEKLKLEEDEQIIAIVRKHWWIITLETLFVFGFALLPVIILRLISSSSLGSLPLNISEFLISHAWEVTYLYVAWLIILWMVLANFWTNYYLDLWAITTHRVVLVDQRGFFRRFISSFRLERLQDMNIEVNGVLATLLDYGTIEAQTAGGSNEKFISHYMPKPQEIKATIVRAADELTATQRSRIETMQEQGL